MEEGNTNPSAGAAGAAAQQQQHLLLQQQLFLMQQQQQQQQQRPRPHIQQPNLQQSQLQQAMARFPSNIDAHLRAPGYRSLQFAQAQLQQGQLSQAQLQQGQLSQAQLQQGQLSQAQLQQQMARSSAPQVRNPEIEMALQDATKVCNPDVKTPFASIEDAVNRLLPYHVVSDYEAEEDDRMVESDKTGQSPSRLQQWDHNILVKISEFTSTFEKQVLAFNIMTRKRSLGEFRSEERLHLEQSLVQNEKRLALETRADIEARQKAAAQMAASAAQADMMVPPHMSAPMHGRAATIRGEDAQDQELMRQGSWAGNASHSGINAANANENENGEEEEEGEEDFLNNDENEEDDDGDDSGGELDLNVRIYTVAGRREKKWILIGYLESRVR